jgi:acetyl/propionyl-CoA carboxylase alpha subunit
MAEYEIGGIRTNLAFFAEIMDDDSFRAGSFSTLFLDEFFARRKTATPALEMEAVAALAAALHRPAPAALAARTSRWLASGLETLLR